MKRISLTLLFFCFLLSGCKKAPPPIVEVEGVVLLNGNPLPNALVEFIPELNHFGAEMNSSGITDEKGFFRLTCRWNNQPGAAVATHRVIITDAPMEGGRGMDPESQAKSAQYYSSLKNRPIPSSYSDFSKTPLRLSVEAGKKTYEISLQR